MGEQSDSKRWIEMFTLAGTVYANIFTLVYDWPRQEKAEPPVIQSVLHSRCFQGLAIFMHRDDLIDSSIFIARTERTFRYFGTH